MRMIFSAAAAVLALSHGAALAQSDAVTATIPVYSRVLVVPVPAPFAAAFENEASGSYILEFVPDGETVENWTQMITVTGAQGAAANGASPMDIGNSIGSGFQSACPDSFRAWNQGEVTVEGATAAQVFLLACGDLNGQSERALILVAVDEANIYTLQWAERGAAVDRPEEDLPIWEPRGQMLTQLRLCTPAEGEAAPYPSCLP